MNDMKAIAVLFAGRLAPAAFEPFLDGRSSLTLSVERARAFPDVCELAILADEAFQIPADLGSVRVERSATYGKRSILDRIASLSDGYDLVYFAWADCPLLDPDLAASLRDRHLRFAAEYTFADGWPYGFAPELLCPTTAATLAYLAGDDNGRVERDLLFSVVQKDINSFDIETEISPTDLRLHRLTLAADSKRNLTLMRGLSRAGLTKAADAERVLTERPDLLRPVPAFYSIQIASGCPQSCFLCPYPRVSLEQSGKTVLERREELESARFVKLLDEIVAFSGDAVIDLSLWGECSLHSRIDELIKSVLDRPSLSLIIETSGIGWKPGVVEAVAEAAAKAPPRANGLAPISWIVSLDAEDPERYAKLRGEGYAEARALAERLIALFPKDAFVQAIRINEGEDDLEKFYRAWKTRTPNVIVQKHDDFCGYMPSLKATDLSPVKRFPCRHLMRDISVLLDGTVPVCKEDLCRTTVLGNAYTQSLAEIWEAGVSRYASHCAKSYPDICGNCDEYYTYNF
ncbi:MAG: spiro-SPASM protein [Treponemataceae bacterium]